MSALNNWVFLLPWPLINDVSDRYGIESKIIAAMVSVESSGNTCATRYEPHYRWTDAVPMYARRNKITEKTEELHQKTSWGLMQVMGGTARSELNFDGHLSSLCFPEIGLDLGVKYFKKLLDKYDNLWDAVSAYNAGSPRKDINGTYSNQHYVEKVKTRIAQIDDIRGAKDD